MNKKVLGGAVAIVGAVFLITFMLIDLPSTRQEGIEVARAAATSVLLNPNNEKIKVYGDRPLIENCLSPQLETTYALSEKGRYEFRVRCAGKEPIFMLVVMRKAPPDYIAINQQSGFVAQQ